MNDITNNTIRIGIYDVPEPIRTPPDKDTVVYFIVNFTTVFRERYLPEYHDLALANGLVHYTEDAAKLHIKALTSLSKPEN